MHCRQFVLLCTAVGAFLMPFAISRALVAACSGNAKLSVACPDPATTTRCTGCIATKQQNKEGGYFSCDNPVGGKSCFDGQVTDEAKCYTEYDCVYDDQAEDCVPDLATGVVHYKVQKVDEICSGE